MFKLSIEQAIGDQKVTSAWIYYDIISNRYITKAAYLHIKMRVRHINDQILFWSINFFSKKIFAKKVYTSSWAETI